MGLNLKPGASLRTHHYFAASVWSLVGLFLLIRGCLFLRQAGQMWLLLPALAVGTAKSRFMLDRAAGRNLTRLAGKRDGDCLGGVYSAKMWGLVAAMMIMGWLLRHSGLPWGLVGFIYAAIGWAMFFSSRIPWRQAVAFAAAP